MTRTCDDIKLISFDWRRVAVFLDAIMFPNIKDQKQIWDYCNIRDGALCDSSPS